MRNEPRVAFAGDRNIAVQVLDYLLKFGTVPLALLVAEESRASHSGELEALLPELPPERVLRGTHFRRQHGLDLLESLNLDFVVSIHFPYIVPPEALDIPRQGWLNLHPALLPFNRGWHTPTWSILDGTPAGATLHFMDDGLDTGDIVARRPIDVHAGDTAHTLYTRILEHELEVFRGAWAEIAAGRIERLPQDPAAGTHHARADLFSPAVQRIELTDTVTAGGLLQRLRALTTSELAEAAYYEADGRRFRVQVVISEDDRS